MGTIEEIIKAIDVELINSNKEYLLLGNANQLLVNKNIISISEKYDKTLKKILEGKKIPHAYQTETTPKQWRIPLSEKGKLQRLAKKQKTRTPEPQKTKKESIKILNLNLKKTVCPSCGIQLNLTSEIINEKSLLCLNCGWNFKNPLLIQNSKNQNLNKISNTSRNWLIAIAILLITWIMVSISNNNNSDSSNCENYSNEGSNKEFYQNTPSETNNSIDLNNFTGQKFTFKSTVNDNELNGEIVQTNHETTYHTFDFINLTVTTKSPFNGKWVTITYPMKNFYKEKGIAATTYVITVNEFGVKEIWYSPDVPNLGYDYENGTRIACYDITKVNNR